MVNDFATLVGTPTAAANSFTNCVWVIFAAAIVLLVKSDSPCMYLRNPRHCCCEQHANDSAKPHLQLIIRDCESPCKGKTAWKPRFSWVFRCNPPSGPCLWLSQRHGRVHVHRPADRDPARAEGHCSHR